jgi:hypothetical protein
VLLRQIFKSFRENRLGFVLVLTILAVPFYAKAQTIPAKNQPPWQESLTPAAKGTQVPVPKQILKKLRNQLSECADSLPYEKITMDAYEIHNAKLKLVAIWARNACLCGATGNCEFWVYRVQGGRYEQVLETGLVREFGFLKATTNGLPDLVLWSHDSAQRYPGALWQFGGSVYESRCGWEIVSKYEELPDRQWKLTEEHVESNTCPGFDQEGKRLKSKN